jgi:Xaa-Pro aminopeptidase
LQHELEPQFANVVTNPINYHYCRKLSDFVGLSFDTISATGPNGSIIHYKPEEEHCRFIDPEAIYLCDSGAQFLDGTTDVTRTMHFGTPTDFEKDAYTRVLKGHIQIDMTVFPRGTTGTYIAKMNMSSTYT